MHCIGIIHITTNLISKAYRKIDCLPITVNCKTTCMLWHSFADNRFVILVHNTITCCICKFRHTRYGGLSICCQYFNSIRIIHNTLNIQNAWFQCVFTIRISKIINRIISFRFKTLDRTYRMPLTDNIIISRLSHR